MCSPAPPMICSEDKTKSFLTPLCREFAKRDVASAGSRMWRKAEAAANFVACTRAVRHQLHSFQLRQRLKLSLISDSVRTHWLRPECQSRPLWHGALPPRGLSSWIVPGAKIEKPLEQQES